MSALSPETLYAIGTFAIVLLCFLTWPATRRLPAAPRVFVAVVAAVTCVGALPEHAAAQQLDKDRRAGDTWVPLGCRDVGFRVDRDTIEVGRSDGRFRAIRLKVQGASVHMLDLTVVYGSGEPDRLQVRSEIRPGEQTRPLDLSGRQRSIRQIDIAYRAQPNFAGRATVCAEGLPDIDRPAGGGARSTSRAQPQAPAAAPPAQETSRAERLDRSRSDPEPPQSAQAPAKAPQAPGAVPSAKQAPVFRSRPQPPAAARQEPWDVVPVYYGTDRNAQPLAQRASYGSARGKRLELGRALVTVPLAHKVPEVERPWVYHLPFTSIVLYREREDPKIHFTLKEVQTLSKGEFLALVRERLAESKSYKDHALVFVHGFNTTFDNALFRTAQIAYDLKFDGAPFVYSWPSQGQVGFQDYSYDRESTGQAEPYFRQFLELVTRETGAKSVSIIGHSMGNQLLLSALRDIKRSAPTGVIIHQVILAAPDVDRDGFEFLAKEIEGVCSGITLLAASNDRALEISRRFWGGVPRAGDVPLTGPIVLPGIDTIDITATSTEVFSINHNGYAEQPTLLSDMQILIRSGTRPPEKRVPALERIKTDKGEYWRYPRGK